MVYNFARSRSLFVFECRSSGFDGDECDRRGDGITSRRRVHCLWRRSRRRCLRTRGSRYIHWGQCLRVHELSFVARECNIPGSIMDLDPHGRLGMASNSLGRRLILSLSRRLRQFISQLSPDERRKRRRALIFLAFVGPLVEGLILYLVLHQMGASNNVIVFFGVIEIPLSLLLLRWLIKAAGLTSKQLDELDSKEQSQT